MRRHRPRTGDGTRLSETHTWRIVGPDETDAKKGWISVDSPLARAVLKKRVDEEFEAELPGGKTRFFVLSIDYPVAGNVK